MHQDFFSYNVSLNKKKLPLGSFFHVLSKVMRLFNISKVSNFLFLVRKSLKLKHFLYIFFTKRKFVLLLR